jgi:hypothetical protein
MGFFSEFFNVLKTTFKAFFGDPDTKRILETGKRAEAKILSLNESGAGYVTVNEQPYVKLELEIFPEEGGASYKTTLATIISRLAVPQFQPDNVIYVKIDPKDPKKVVFDTTRASNDLPVVGNKENVIKEGGPKGFAEVLGIEKTDKIKDGTPVYMVKFEITGEKIDTYKFEKEIPLPDYAFKFFIVGKKFKCRVDPDDKTKVDMEVR